MISKWRLGWKDPVAKKRRKKRMGQSKAKLKALRKKHGLGEFSKGKKRKSSKKKSKSRGKSVSFTTKSGKRVTFKSRR